MARASRYTGRVAFLSQVLAVLLATALVGLLVQDRLSARGLHSGAAVVAVALLAVVFFASVLPSRAGFRDARKSNAALNEEAAEVQGGASIEPSVQWPFIEWVRQRVPDHASYAVLPELNDSEGAWQWTTYRMLPRRVTSPERKPEWLLFYGRVPAFTGYDRDAYEKPVVYQPGYAVARKKP